MRHISRWAWLNRIWKSNQCGYVVIQLPGSQRTRYYNFVPPLHSRVFRILKSTRRDKPLLYSCRAANLLQETYLGCITIWKANFFWQAISKKQKFPRRTYLLPSSLLVVAKSTANFFSSWANYSCFFWTSLLPCWFEKQAAVKYRSAYLWKHASCKLFPFSKLYCFGLDKKTPFHEIWD